MAFTAGMDLTAAELNGTVGVTKVKTGNKTMNNNSTYSPDSELTFQVAANTTYIFEMMLNYSAAAAADVKIAFTGPAGMVSVGTPDCPPTGVSSTSTTIDRGVSTDFSTAGGVAMGAIGAGGGNRIVAKPSGHIVTSGAAGTITLQFAQLTANASDAVLYAGSWFRLTRAS